MISCPLMSLTPRKTLMRFIALIRLFFFSLATECRQCGRDRTEKGRSHLFGRQRAGRTNATPQLLGNDAYISGSQSWS